MPQGSPQGMGLQPMSDAEFRYKVSHAGRIVMPAFKVCDLLFITTYQKSYHMLTLSDRYR